MIRSQQLPLILAMLAVAVTSPRIVTAQTVEWIRQFGSPEGDTAHSVSADALGNVFVSGFTQGSVGGPFQGIHDGFFAKYDAEGTRFWAKQLGTSGQETAWGISADGFGNVYVEGDTSGNLFGTTLGPWDVWLAKYDGNGSLLWGRQIESAADEEYGTVAADPLGGVYISGLTQGSLGAPNGGGADQFLARYSADGDLIWTRQLASPGWNNYSRLAVDSSGNVYIGGGIRDSLFGPNAGENDAYLAKYDREGTFLWGKQYGTTADDLQSGGVSTDSLGNVFVLGSTKGNLGGPNSGDYDVFLTKFSADGTQVWTRQFGTTLLDAADYSYGGGVATDGKGNVYITGRAGGDLGWGSNGDVFVAKYDTNGNLVWGQQLGTPEGEGGARISSDSRGNIYFSGRTGGSLGGPLSEAGDAFLGKFRDKSVPGDFNNNDTVDAADYLVWRNSVGQTGAALAADGDASGTIDAGDYNLWRAHFGQSTATNARAVLSSSANPAVPEPTSAVMVFVAMSLLTSSRRGRIRPDHYYYFA